VGRVRQAQLHIAGQRLRSLPLPFASDAGFVLELEMGDGLFCRLKGQGLALQLCPVDHRWTPTSAESATRLCIGLDAWTLARPESETRARA
jgi:hypothetical protein